MKSCALGFRAGCLTILMAAPLLVASGHAGGRQLPTKTVPKATAPALARERLTRWPPRYRGTRPGGPSAHRATATQPEWLQQLGSSQYEQATGVAASFGTLYTVGYTGGTLGGTPSAGGFDLFVAKHDVNGRPMWLRQSGTAANDYATGIALHDGDSSNVAIYVTGYTTGALEGNTNAGGQDFFLVRYDSQGIQQWASQSGSKMNDFAQAVSTDPEGNVYVAGYTSGALDGNTSAGGQDLFLARYDAQGVRQWVQQYGSSANDQARGVATDSKGNVYVVGFTSGRMDEDGSAGDQDFFLVKYDSKGARQWVRQVGTNRKDVAQAVATSRRSTGEIEIYVVGRTEGSTQGVGLDGAPQRGSYDLFVAKYDAAGARQWLRQTGTTGEDSASAVASDGAGNVYVTGSSPVDLETGASLGSNDLLMLKYNAAGTLLASRQLGSENPTQPARASDWGFGIAADRERGVYVAGYVEGGFGGRPGAGDKDLVLMKYPDGCEVDAPGQCSQGSGWGAVSQWSRQLGTTGDEYPGGVSTSCDGSIYVVGHVPQSLEGLPHSGGLDLFVAKYTPGGSRSWTRELGSSGDDFVMGSTTDASGNLYVVGATNGVLDGNVPMGDFDLFVVKFDASGKKQWTRLLGTATYDQATSVTQDGAGNVYVAGVTYGGLDGNTNAGGDDGDMFLVKFNAAGQKQWTRQLGTPALDQADSVAADSAGNIYVSGLTQGVFPGNVGAGGQDLVVARFSSDGARQWIRQLGTSDDDSVGGIATDSLGRVYVSASTWGSFAGQPSAGGLDLLLVKLGSDGAVLWSRQAGTSGNEMAGDVALDPQGNAYVVGSTDGAWQGNASAGNLDMTVARFTPNGGLEWVHQFGTSEDDYASDLAVDFQGNPTLAAATYGVFNDNTQHGGVDVLVVRLGLVECGNQCGAGCP